MNIHRIIKESLSKILSEGASPLIYHFCSGQKALELVKSGRLPLNCGEAEINGDGRYYISFTRNRNPQEGFPMIGCNNTGWDDLFFVRIEMDGNMLNTYNNYKVNKKRHSFQVKPFDYVYSSNQGNLADIEDIYGREGHVIHNGKDSDMYGSDSDSSEDGWMNSYGQVDYPNDKYNHPMSQAEDRLTSDTPYIPDCLRFIKNIDIFVRPEASNCIYGTAAENYKEYQKFQYQVYNSINIDKSEFTRQTKTLNSLIKWCEKRGVSYNIYDSYVEMGLQKQRKRPPLSDIDNWTYTYKRKWTT